MDVRVPETVLTNGLSRCLLERSNDTYNHILFKLILDAVSHGNIEESCLEGALFDDENTLFEVRIKGRWYSIQIKKNKSEGRLYV